MRKNLLSLLYVALGATLMAVSGMIYFPLAVPITLQTLVLYTILFLFGGKIGTQSVLVYIALGIVGLPVFSGFRGGIAHILDYGGGFIIGFVIASLVFWLLDGLFSERYRWLSATLSLLFLYATGVLWYAVVYTGEYSLVSIISLCVLPFLLPDAVKIFLAYLISRRLSKTIAKPTDKV